MFILTLEYDPDPSISSHSRLQTRLRKEEVLYSMPVQMVYGDSPMNGLPLQKVGNLPKGNTPSYSKVSEDQKWGKIDEWKLATEHHHKMVTNTTKY